MKTSHVYSLFEKIENALNGISDKLQQLSVQLESTQKVFQKQEESVSTSGPETTNKKKSGISIKVKFRKSSIESKEGVIYYQIIQNRIVRQLKTDYRIFQNEWDEKTHSLKVRPNMRRSSLISIRECIRWDIRRLKDITNQMGKKKIKYTPDDVIAKFQSQANSQSLFNFMRGIITQFKQIGKYRTSETYIATLKSFMTFREDKDLWLYELDSDLMVTYEAYLRGKELSKNTISFYMRVLRAVYNRAVECQLLEQNYPFKHVYTGIEKTVKRAVSLKIIKKIKNLDLSQSPFHDFARDMFMFSFYTRGMSFIDMAHLKKKDLKNNILSYHRRKTGQLLFIKWEKCMQEIVNKYDTRLSIYLLPILEYSYDYNPNQYKNILYRTNKYLKDIAKMIGMSTPLTLYVARHSWASIAKSKHIPISVISESMGHNSEMTTEIYLASLDNSVVDKANSEILQAFDGE